METDYQVAFGKDLDELVKSVDALTKEGYKPIGGISDLGYWATEKSPETKYRLIVQPMIKIMASNTVVKIQRCAMEEI